MYSSNQNPKTQTPCRFFRQGVCNKGNLCKFSHSNNKSKPNKQHRSTNSKPQPKSQSNSVPPLCHFFLSVSGCRHGSHCAFRHSFPEHLQPGSTNALSSTLPVSISTCKCVEDNTNAAYMFQPNRIGETGQLQVLCQMTETQGQTLFQFFPELELYWTPTQTIWNFFNTTNGSAIILRRNGSSFYLEGDPAHYYCILQWLESLLGLFLASVGKVKRKYVMKYSDFIIGEPSPPSLNSRYHSLFKKRLAKTKKKSKAVSHQSTEPLDTQEKSIILEFARNCALSSDSDEETEEFEEEEESDSVDNISSEDLGDVSIFEPQESIVRSDFMETKAYALMYSSTFLERFFQWLSTPTHNIVSLSNIFEARGAWQFLRFSPGAERILGTNSAGCGHACQMSEATSFDILHSLVPNFTLSHSEMEINYLKPNSPKLDYLCKCQTDKIGVSVTRAWNGPNCSYTRNDAHRLLQKKLTGLNNARKFVSPSLLWDKQILHVWTPSENVSVLLQQQLQSEKYLDMTVPTLIVFSSAKFQLPNEISFLFSCAT